MSFDQPQALAFLSALGHTPVTARLRAFPHTSTPAALKKQIGADKPAFDPTSIANTQAAGRGVYVVINQGDHTAKSITGLVAYFAEFDHGDRQSQRDLVNSKMPAPSIIVDSGGKSLQFYWLFDQPVAGNDQSRDHWKQVQRRLAKYLGSDPSINDPSRVMRLPGCDYISAEQKVTGHCHLVHLDAAIRYTPSQLEGLLPPEPPPAPRTAPSPVHTSSSDKIVTSALEQLNRTPSRIPGSGTRDIYLRLLWGLSEIMGPADAASAFARHSPEWAAAEDLLKIAKAANGQITVKTFFKLVKQEWGITASRRSVSSRKPPMQSAQQPTTGTPPLPTPPAGLDQARLQIQQLIAEGCSGSVLQARIADLAIQYEVVTSTLLKIAESLISEDDAAIDAEAELRQIRYDAKLLEERKAFTLENYLPAPCVEPLRYLSTSLQSDDLSTMMIFLTCMTGALKAGTRIWGDNVTFAERPQLWLAVLGKSGRGKSPAIKNLGVNRLCAVIKDYEHRNNKRFTAWEAANAGVSKKDRDPMPKPFVLRISSYTAGSLVEQFSTNEEERLGILMFMDELKALFTSMNQFQSGGKGSEQQQLLSLYDNDGDAQIRIKEGYRAYKEGQLSIIGGVQPLVFDQLAAHGDPDGLFARLIILPLPQRYKGNQMPPDASPERSEQMMVALDNIMLQASALIPIPYYLDPQAQKDFATIRHTIAQDSDNLDDGPESNILGKRAGLVLRLAGALHLLSIACGETPQGAPITAHTLQKAHLLATHLQQYSISAHRRAAQMLEQNAVTDLMRRIHRHGLAVGITSPGRFRSDRLTPRQRKQYSVATINDYVQKLVDSSFAVWSDGGSPNGGKRYKCIGELPGV